MSWKHHVRFFMDGGKVNEQDETISSDLDDLFNIAEVSLTMLYISNVYVHASSDCVFSFWVIKMTKGTVYGWRLIEIISSFLCMISFKRMYSLVFYVVKSMKHNIMDLAQNLTRKTYVVLCIFPWVLCLVCFVLLKEF